MNTQSENFLHILRCILHGGTPSLTDPDWEALLHLSNSHNLLPAVYEAVRRLPEFSLASPDTAQQFLTGAVAQSGSQWMRTESFLELYDQLLEAGAAPLVLKGLVCRSLYPQPELRPSGDEDLWITEKELPLCDPILRQNGYLPELPEEAGRLEEIQEMTYEGPSLTLEMHVNPFGTENGLRRNMNELLEGARQRSVTMELQGHTIHTLSPTDHYLFLYFHIFKHFTSCGVGIRHLMDLLLFRQTFEDEIDFPRVVKAISAIGGETFYAAILEIGRRWLGFSSIPAPGRCPDPAPLLEEILAVGCFGNSDRYQQLSATYINARLLHQEEKRPRLITMLFPPYSRMYHSYPVLLQHPWLLPFMWLARIGKFAKEVLSTDRGLAFRSIRYGKKRTRLLQKYRAGFRK